MAGLVAFLLAMPPAAPEKVFWAWFTANANRVATIEHGHEPIAGELAAHLQAIDPDLTFEVGVKDKPRELIISAGGVKRAFPAVRRLVAAAPEIAGWTVIAFRPRSAGGLIVEFGTYRVDPAQVWFTAEPDRGKCGITLYLPGYRDDADVKNAGYLLLDGALGEYDVEAKVGYIEMHPVPADPAAAGLRPLADLVPVVDRMVAH